MATKKELIDAQGFSRRRLLSAFIGGAPGGKELEPAQPLRAVIAGVTLTAMVILGGVFYGIIRPGLPAGWENNRLILVSDTGARYVSIDRVLYPVINTASARLLIAAEDFTVITTDQKTLEGIEIGQPLGILGAPDALATADKIINDGWTACEQDDTTKLSLANEPIASATDGAVVVTLDDALYVVSGELRYEVVGDEVDSILRAVGLSASANQPVDGAWLNLFEQGQDLAPLEVPNAGTRISGTDFTIGSVIHPLASADDERFLVTEDGELARLSPLGYSLYLLGSGRTEGEVRDANPAEISSFRDATDPAGGGDWPSNALTPAEGAGTLCALLTHVDGAAHTVLATLNDGAELPPNAPPVSVERGHGALVTTGAGSSSLVQLIDESGRAYPVPGATEDVLARLGYTVDNLGTITAPWLAFMPVGPALTQKAAGSSPKASEAAGSK